MHVVSKQPIFGAKLITVGARVRYYKIKHRLAQSIERHALIKQQVGPVACSNSFAVALIYG
jgi:hypothetical protein